MSDRTAYRKTNFKSMAAKKKATHHVRPNEYVSTRRIMGGNPRSNLPATLNSNQHELKALDVPVASYSLSTTAAITPLNLIRTGSTFCNRVGRKVEMKSIRITGQVSALRTSINEDYLRIMIVYDRQTNGTLPAIQDVIQTTDQAAANTSTAFSGINLNNRDRFIMLRDTRIPMPQTTITAGVLTNLGFSDPVTTLCNIDMYVKLKNLVTQYKADSSPAVIGDIATGSLLLITLSDSLAGLEGFVFEAESRLRYIDL